MSSISSINDLPNDSFALDDTRSDGGTTQENVRSVRTIFGCRFYFGCTRDLAPTTECLKPYWFSKRIHANAVKQARTR
jgi:hypothetical protein